MKQKIKQLLMAIMGLLLSTSAFAHDFSVGGIYYNYLDKTAKTVAVTYKGSSYSSYSNEYTGTITIPSSVTYSGTTYSVTSIGDSAFEYCSGLTSVTIPNSVTSIGYSAFRSCSGLTSITIPNSVTSIGSESFKWCSGLTSITIPNSVTSIDDAAFYDCDGLTSVTIPNSVTSIGSSAFSGCSGLTSITIPNSVTSIGNYAFSYCSGLTSITIPNSVTSIGYAAFYDCDGLTEVNISDLSAWCKIDFENYIANPFYYAKEFKLNGIEIKDLVIPDDITEIKHSAFYGCSGLTSITIPNSVTSIGYSAFYDCDGLTSVTIPNSVTSIGNSAFYGCSNIHSFTIGSGISSISSNTFSVKPQKTIWLTNTPPSGSSYASGTVNYVANEQYSSLSNVVVYPYLSSMFEVDGVKYVPVSPSERTCDAIDCSYNSTDSIINIGNTVSFKGVAMSVKDIKPYTCYGNDYIKKCTINNNGNIGEYAFNGCSAIEKASINAKSIAESAFSNCSAIETITLGNELETIGNSAFESCSKLNEVVIPNSVTSLGESAFYGCSSLASATIGNAVENINSSTFYNCKSLENITIGNTVKSIGNNTFYGCSSLPSIEIPKNVTSIGDYAFDDCSKLNDVIIEDRDTVLTLGSNGSSPIFSDCPLDSVYIGGDISYKTTSSYGYSPFYNNKTLRAVTITDKETEISENEFYGCANLKSVSIGDGVEIIGKYAFSGCSSLESFAFGSSMKTIGEEAFSDCTALIKLSSKATTPPACGTQALDDINKWNCELIVPDDAISAYQTADQWKEFFFISPNKIDEITTNVNDAIEIARYDIHGRLLSEPTKGINIIKYSDGSTRKEIVK